MEDIMTINSITLTLNSDSDLIAKEVPSQRILEIAVKAPKTLNTHERPSLNLAIVLDRSGSMSGDKIQYVKEATSHVLDLLQEQDQVSIVAFDDQIDTIAQQEHINQTTRTRLKSIVNALQAGSQTDLGGGWLQGCQLAANGMQEERLSRALLLTDGQANVGITDVEELGHHSRELHTRGVSTSTFGVGDGYDEVLLEQMANQGGGNFYFIESPMLIPEIFMKELKYLSTVTLRDVEISLNIPPKVDVQVQGGWKLTQTDDKVRISIGGLVSEQQREVYVKLLFPPKDQAESINFQVKVVAKNEDGQVMEADFEKAFLYAGKAEVEASPLREDVKQRYSVVEVAETAKEALILERRGEGEKASKLLNHVLRDNMPNMPAPIVAEYQGMAKRMEHGMDELDRKQSHYTQYQDKQRRR